MHLKLVTTSDLEVNVGRGMSLKLTAVTKHSLSSLSSPSWNISTCRRQPITSTKTSCLLTGAKVPVSHIVSIVASRKQTGILRTMMAVHDHASDAKWSTMVPVVPNLHDKGSMEEERPARHST